MLGKRRQKTATATLQSTLIGHGREPWSSGYERDSRSKGCGFELQHWMNIFHIDLLQKLYCLFEKTEIKWKRGRGWHIFLKKKTINWSSAEVIMIGPKPSRDRNLLTALIGSNLSSDCTLITYQMLLAEVRVHPRALRTPVLAVKVSLKVVEKWVNLGTAYFSLFNKSQLKF